MGGSLDGVAGGNSRDDENSRQFAVGQDSSARRLHGSFNYSCAANERSDLRDVSDGVFGVLGYKPADFTGQHPVNFLDLVHADDRQHLRTAIHDAIRGAHPFQIRYRVSRADGRLCWLWEKGQPVFDTETQQVRGVAGYVLDVTELVAALDFERVQAERDASLRSIYRVAELLRENLGPNSPLTNSTLGPRRQSIEELEPRPAVQQPVVRELLSLLQQRTIERCPVDLNQLASTEVSRAQSALHPNGNVQLSLQENLPKVICDRRQMQELFRVLLFRALRASPKPECVVIETVLMARSPEGNPTNAAQCVGLLISDEGERLTAEQIRRLFEAFEDDGTGHTGLELALASHAVAGFGGQLHATPRASKGLRISVIVPAQRSGETAPSTSVVRPRSTPDRTVLVVDDTPIVRRTTSMALKRAGFRVLVAGSAQEALSTAEANHYAIDALVTDVVMPGTTGLELAAELRRRAPRIRILYVSGYPEETAVSAEALDQHTVFLQKPFSFKELAATVSTLIKSLDESR